MTRPAGTYPGLRAAGPLRIGGLEAALPLVQGGMGVGVSLAGLASAVAEEGGIGVISAACIGRTPGYAQEGISDAEALKREIRKARQRTGGILGVNIMVALKDFEALAKAAAEEGADLIISGAGLPLTLPGCLKPASRSRLVPIVSSGKAAALIIRWWKAKYGRLPDAFVVEGPLAGGHLGFSPGQIPDPAFALENLTRDVITECGRASDGGPGIPVIAAGGIYTGGDIRRFLRLGAAGVQMATRFIATHECDAPPAFKQACIDCRQEDIFIVKSPVGMPGRALANRFARRAASAAAAPFRCRHHCITSCGREESPYCIAEALLQSITGDPQEGLVFVGANAWRLGETLSVRDLIHRLDQEYLRSGNGGEACGRPEERIVAV